MKQFDSQLLFFKPGTTYGEAAGSFLGTNVLPAFGIEMGPLAAEVVEREQADPHGGRTVKPAMAAKFGTLSFSTYDLASGTAGTAPATSGLLQACGMTLATVPVTSCTYSLSDLNLGAGFGHFLFHHAGGEYYLDNARGSVEITFAAGQLPVHRYTFEGIYRAPTDNSVIAPTYPTTTLPVTVDAVNTATFNLGTSGTPIAREFSNFTLNLGNSLVRESNPGGGQRVRIASCAPTASVSVRRTDLAAFNPFELAANETENRLELVHGAAGSRSRIILPRFTYNASSTEDNENSPYDNLELFISHDANTLNHLTLAYL
jgi:hypothetical protein